MISNPKHGWCDFKLNSFSGNPSFLTDVPVDLLDAFISYFEKGVGIAWFDEEGTDFTLAITPYSLYIIEEKDKPLFHDFSEITIYNLTTELINDIENNLDDWSKEFIVSDNKEEISRHKYEIVKRLDELKDLSGYLD